MNRVLFLSVLLVLAVIAGARAESAGSQAWFSTLSETDRTDIQRNLILTGQYGSLVDGQFGPGTYRAITAYQASKGYPATGILSSEQSGALLQDAGASFQALGIDLIRDEKANIALTVPLKLLSIKSEGREGVSYSTPDHGIVLSTEHLSLASERFSQQFTALTVPTNGTVLTYKAYNDRFFVLSGYAGDRRFYTLFQHTDTESVGYTVSWSETYQREGNLIAVFAASYSSPLSALPPVPPPVQATSSDRTDSVTFGSFLYIPSVPQVLALNGDIGDGAQADFMTALLSHPEVTTVVLNSTGGKVKEALGIARAVQQHHLDTLILKDFGCYSACAYIYFAGVNREDDGNLGVHQIYGDGVDAEGAQSVLSVVLDALDEYGVSEHVISVMLATPPSDIHVFTSEEVASFGIDRGPSITGTGSGAGQDQGVRSGSTGTAITAADLGL